MVKTFLCLLLIFLQCDCPAVIPSWWPMEGGRSEDYAVANQGQLKNFGVSAYDAMEAQQSGGAGSGFRETVESWFERNADKTLRLHDGLRVPLVTEATADYAAVNVGQLKAVAMPLYDRLMELGLVEGYPWRNGGYGQSNYSLVNVGQLKETFNVPLQLTLDAYGRPDWWSQIALQFGIQSLDPNRPSLGQPSPGTSPFGVPDPINSAIQAADEDLPYAPGTHTEVTDEGGIRIWWTNELGEFPEYRVYVASQSSLMGSGTGWTLDQTCDRWATEATLGGLLYGDTYHYLVIAITANNEQRVMCRGSVTPQLSFHSKTRSAYLQYSREGADALMTGFAPDFLEGKTVNPNTVDDVAEAKSRFARCNLTADLEDGWPASHFSYTHPPQIVPMVHLLETQFRIASNNPGAKYSLRKFFAPLLYVNGIYQYGAYEDKGDIGAFEGPDFEGGLKKPDDFGFCRIAVLYHDAVLSAHGELAPERTEETVGMAISDFETADVSLNGPWCFWTWENANDVPFSYQITGDPGKLEVYDVQLARWVGLSNQVFPATPSALNGGEGPRGAAFRVRFKDGVEPGTATIITSDLMLDNKVLATDRIKIKKSLRKSAISTEETSGPSYRKIGLNGRPMPDNKPQRKADEVGEPEETFVDAMNLGLRHSTTDVYVPLPGSELALSIRRDSVGEIWSTEGGARPHERLDRPFGPCWTSNVSSYLSFDDSGLVVHDLDGVAHRFVYFWGYWLPMARGRQESESHLTRLDFLEVQPGVWVYRFRDKRGTEILFDLAECTREIPGKRGELSRQGTDTLRYYRAIQATDRVGNQIRFTYGVEGSIIPTKIYGAKPACGAITIEQNAGRVTGIWDLNGNHYQYSYGKFQYGLPGGLGPDRLKETYLQSVVGPDAKSVDYTYDFTSAVDLDTPSSEHLLVPKTYWFADIKTIRNQDNVSWSFTYEMDRSRHAYQGGSGFLFNPVQSEWKGFASVGYYVQFPVPRYVSAVAGPTGIATFENQSDLRLTNGPGRGDLSPTLLGLRRTVAHSVPVSGQSYDTTYNFGTPEIYRMDAFDPGSPNVPLLYCYTILQVGHSNGGSETFRFDPKAGMALAETKDLSGNTTEFKHEEVIPIDPEDVYYELFNFAGFNSRFSEVTKQVNAQHKERSYGYSTKWRLPLGFLDEEGGTTTWIRDALGRVTSEVSSGPRGGETKTEYEYLDPNVPGLPTSKKQIDVQGGPGAFILTNYSYDGAGRLSSEVVDPNGLAITRSYGYDASGNRLRATDPNGNSTSFSYDERHRLVSVGYRGGYQKQYLYDGRGNKVKEVDENGVATEFFYNSLGCLTQTSRRGMTVAYEYDELGSQTAVVDANGNRLERTFDTLQRVVEEKDALGHSTFFAYGANSGGSVFSGSGFKPTSATDRRGFTTTTAFDSLYRPKKITKTYGPNLEAVTEMTYDDVGNLLSEKDPLLKVTSHAWDSLNRETLTTFADGKTRSMHYNGLNQLVKTVDERNYETRNLYDAAGRRVKVVGPELGGVVLPETATTETVYDAAGNVQAVVDGRQYRWDYVYDGRNRKIAEQLPAVAVSGVVLPQRPVLRWYHDGVGNALATVDARGNATLMSYDAFGRMTRRVLPGNGAVHNWQYDGAGNLVQETDELGRKTVNTYDDLNRLVSTIDAQGIRVKTEYDEEGNRTKVIDGKEQATTFSYDGLRRVTEVKDAAGRSTTFSYDAVNKTTRTDSNLAVTQYTYDDRHRVLAVAYPAHPTENLAYAYDDAGHLLSVTGADPNAPTTVAYTYDPAGRVKTETSAGVTHSYEYDLAGNRTVADYGTRLGPGSIRHLSSTYDALNRLVNISEGARATAYEYDLSGNLVKKTLPNGDVESTTYDEQNRAVSATCRTAPATDAPGGILRFHYALTYDRAGNVTKSDESYGGTLPPRLVEMTYDRANRLTKEKVTEADVRTTNYAYDAANNRSGKATQSANAAQKSWSYTYNSLNQLETVDGPDGSATFSYDFNGNRTKREEGAETINYTYDSENRLVHVAGGLHGGQLDQSYAYDYRSRRVQRSEGTATTSVVFSGGSSVQEWNGQSLATEYFRGSDWGGGVGGLLYSIQNGSGGLRFSHYNHRGDMILESDGGGNATWEGQYEAFGTRDQQFGTKVNRQTANTKEEDPGGLLNEGMRYRDLETGTFLTRDPAGFVDGPNLYAYVRQNPWSKFDPEGLQTFGQAWTDFALHDDMDLDRAAKGPDLVTATTQVAGATAQAVLIVAPGPKVGAGVGAAERTAVSIEESAGKAPGFFSKAWGKFTGLFRRGGGAAAEDAAAMKNAGNAGQIEESAAKTRAVQEGEVGLYGDLKNRSVPHDGLDIHEVPSSAAQIAAKESELGRKLTDAEKAELKASNPSIAIRSETHALTDTYKGRNTPTKIASDAANLPAAAERGANDVISAGQKTGVDLTDQAKKLREMTK